MFDIGFWELVVIAVVALVVVGPKELPGLLRGVSSWIGQARAIAGEFKNELSREAAQAEELKRLVEREAEVAELHRLLDEARAKLPVDSLLDGDKTAASSAGDARPDTPPKPEATPSGRDRDGQPR